MRTLSAGSVGASDADVEPAIPLHRRVWGVIRRPASTFEWLSRNPDIVTPVALQAIVAGLLASATVPAVLEQVNATAGEAAIPQAALPAVSAAAVIVGAITSVAVLLAVSSVVYLLGKGLSGNGTARGTLSTMGYAMLPVVARNAFRAVYLLAFGREPVSISIAGLWGNAPPEGLGALIAGLDVFTLWTAALTVVAVSATFRMRLLKSTSLMGVLWLLALGAQLLVFSLAT